ncbi:MAG TPA: GGDEF domain-containing protein [Polyangia bacterium]|nr:GGDEF domain-containing protein [Polyangia bacterium]
MSDAKNRTVAMQSVSLKVSTGDGPAVLVQVYPPGPNLGRRFPLSGEEHIVGRLDEVDISIQEDAVSRRHARLYRDTRGWTVEDLGSTNGSWVNDERIARRELHDGDMLRFGSAILKFLSGDNVEAAYHEEIYRMSILDGLTGVHNKRYFLEFLEREIARSVRYQSPLSLVMFDIDHFKHVNDTHGHLAGDAVLRELGRRLKPRVRREDLLARYGGEEFACVLASTPGTSAVRFAEDLRALIARDPFAHEALLLPITISLGVAELDETQRTPDSLIARADHKLYEAKHGGRNRVVG